MLNLRALLRRRTAWSIAVYFQPTLTLPPRGPPAYLIRTNRARRLPNSPHTCADPFLFPYDGRLYLFYETQIADDFGQIALAIIDPAGLTQLGTVLAEPFHLSSPCVFSFNETMYLIPESHDSNEVRLYRFDLFPNKLVFIRTLVVGNFVDPTISYFDGLFYIFATSSNGLEIFVTHDLEDGNVAAHPCNPITNDPRFSRSGGMPFTFEGQLVRPAQNCATRYGENLSLLAIKKLSPFEYREEPMALDLFTSDQDWNRAGSHHVSTCAFEGGIAVAVDGQAADPLYQKFLIRAWMLVTGRKRRLKQFSSVLNPRRIPSVRDF